MLCITHWTSSSSSLLSGFMKIFTCFQNETKVHQHLPGRRGGIGCIQLPFGWTCHTKSSHTGHGSIVKSFTQKGDLCYTEVSDSSSAHLVTWHSQRAVRIAWYCRPESKEKIFPWNQHGQAQSKTLQLLLQAAALLWECLPPLGAGTGQCSSPGLV